MSPQPTETARSFKRCWLKPRTIWIRALLGEAGESLGMDRLLKSNTTSKRVHSLFRQGCMLYELMPGMSERRLAPLVERFAELIHQRQMFQTAFSRL